MVTKYIAYDCETGGLTDDCSLLTAHFLILDDKFSVIDELALQVKPNNNGPYVVTAEALRINKINLVTHDADAITEGEAGQRLRQFLWIHSENGRIKLVPVGQNIAYDEAFINSHILGKKEYEKYVSYRKLDTGTIAVFLQAKGLIPKTVRGSLQSLMDFFEVKFDGEHHEARADTIASVEVLKKMLEL